MRFWSRISLAFDRTLADRGGRQWLIPLISMLISFLIVAVVFWLINGTYWMLSGCFDAAADYHPSNVLDAAFYHLFTNGGQNLMGQSHLLGYVVVMTGIIALAIVTSAITTWMERRAQSYLSGETHYFHKDHVVVFGANDVLYSIIAQLQQKKEYRNRFFLVQTSKDVETVRREFFSFLPDQVNRSRILFVYGDRTSIRDVDKLCIRRAKEVFIIGDDSENENGESYRDSYNIECIETMYASLKKNPRRMPVICRIMFEYQTTFSVFQYADISSDIKTQIQFEPFNFHEMWAQKVLLQGKASLENGKVVRYDFLDKLGENRYIDEQSHKRVHLVIVGMSKMGVALALEAAQVCHYPNYVRDKKLRTRITFIDEQAFWEQDFLRGRFPHLNNLSIWRKADADVPEDNMPLYKPELSECTNGCQDGWLDVEWEFIRGRVSQKEVQRFLKDSSADEQFIQTVAVCFPSSHQTMATALYLPEIVYERSLQILVYQRLSGEMISMISGDGPNTRYRNLKPFGMVSEGYTANLTDRIGPILVNHAYSGKLEELSDSPDWKEKLEGLVREWYDTMLVSDRWSSTFNFNSIGQKLRSVHYSPEDALDIEKVKELVGKNFRLLVQVEHNRWNIEKLLAGFRPLTTEELLQVNEFDYQKEYAQWKDRKKQFQKELKAHADLCDYETLMHRDPHAIEFDETLTRSIPAILEILERLKA